MHKRQLLTLALASAALVATSVDAQVRRVITIPQAPRQAAPAGLAFGAPSPSGLASPNPAQLTPPGTPNLASPGSAPGSPIVDAGVAQPYVGGGGLSYTEPYTFAAGGTNSMGAAALPQGPLSAVEIARAFMDADLNRDGELSRDEAQRLAVLPVPFDDLDRSRNGALSRFEYDDAFR